MRVGEGLPSPPFCLSTFSDMLNTILTCWIQVGQIGVLTQIHGSWVSVKTSMKDVITVRHVSIVLEAQPKRCAARESQ